jgi:hypothetical protein
VVVRFRFDASFYRFDSLTPMQKKMTTLQMRNLRCAIGWEEKTGLVEHNDCDGERQEEKVELTDRTDSR